MLRRTDKTGILIVALVWALIVATGCAKEEGAPAVSSTEVPVIQLHRQDVPLPIEFVGQTKGAVDAEVRARVEGVLLGVHYQEGKEVREGDLLYTIDPAPYQAKLAEANAKVAEAETRLAKATSDLKRIRPLAAMRAVSERDLDSAIAQEGVAKGAVDAAKASYEAVSIELGYTKIYAPVSGIIGLTKAKTGEFVGRSPNPIVLTTISQLEPIHVRFSVGERDYLYFARLRQEQVKNGDTPQPRALALELSDGTTHPETGTVASVDSQIDPSTGALAVEASFPNPGKVLRPGQFVKVKTIGETIRGAIVIPKAAIRDIQGVKQVAVVGADNLIEIRTVTLDREIGPNVIVKEGVKEGELIVPEAQQRLKSGTQVVPKVRQ